MQINTVSKTLPTTLQQRRKRLAELIEIPVILWSGQYTSRNFPDNTFPFRASSHFLYFAGLPLENAAIRLDAGKLELFMDDAPPEASLWHGEMPKRNEIAAAIGADRAYPLSELAIHTDNAATVAVQDSQTYRQQCQLLQRDIPLPPAATAKEADLIKAIVTLRLCHDPEAISELKKSLNSLRAMIQIGFISIYFN